MMLSEPIIVNAYVSPLTGGVMLVADHADPCQGGRKSTFQGKTNAEIQAHYWGRMKYRIRVRRKISDADWFVHSYFEDVKKRMSADEAVVDVTPRTISMPYMPNWRERFWEPLQ